MDEHADKYIERILFSWRLPNLQDLVGSATGIGEDVRRCCSLTYGWSSKAQNLREAIAYAEAAFAIISRDMMIEILADEEAM